LGSALTFSLLWRFEKSVAGLAGLSLAVGVGIVRTLRRLGAGVELKWPNDVLYQGRKLGGILIEVRGDALGPCNAVIGIGLNVHLRGAERAAIDQAVADLSEAVTQAISRTRLLIELLGELYVVLETFAAHGFAAIRGEWVDYHCHQDQAVRLSLPDGSAVRGVARGVDESGRLLLEVGTVVKAYLAGDVSLRSAHDTGD
jgi:BirA family biotin operon repressor/biotin-[acetyl-CoA-carboxylase] ligase